MDFGNIIFIGLVVIAVVSNVVKTAKKAQASQQKPLVGRPLAEAAVVQTTPTRTNKSKPARPAPAPPTPMFAEGERQIFADEDVSIVDTAREYDFTNPAEIRKGIIFSEILNRKY